MAPAASGAPQRRASATRDRHAGALAPQRAASGARQSGSTRTRRLGAAPRPRRLVAGDAHGERRLGARRLVEGDGVAVVLDEEAARRRPEHRVPGAGPRRQQRAFADGARGREPPAPAGRGARRPASAVHHRHERLAGGVRRARHGVDLRGIGEQAVLDGEGQQLADGRAFTFGSLRRAKSTREAGRIASTASARGDRRERCRSFAQHGAARIRERPGEGRVGARVIDGGNEKAKDLREFPSTAGGARL